MNQADDLPLRNRRVLVTRPVQQSRKLCDLVRSAGGEPMNFPVIEIEPVTLTDQEINSVKELRDGDIVIFVSRNAVSYVERVVPNTVSRFGSLNILAVGAGTRNALLEMGISHVVSPEDGSGSEALLNLDLLRRKSMRGINVVIMRGRGGRELLQDTLRERGANVITIDLYQRIMPEVDHETITGIWHRTPPDVIVVTSGDGLHNLIEMTPERERDLLFNTQLVVISDRVRDLAISSGFMPVPRVSGTMDDHGLLRKVIEYVEEKNNE